MSENYALELLEKELYYYKSKLIDVKNAFRFGHNLIELRDLCEKRISNLNESIEKITGGNKNE